MIDKNLILDFMESKQDIFTNLSDEVWGYAETAFLEDKSAKAIADVLRNEGFEIEEGVAGVSTAFTAKFGTGKPIIGVLGEFDALSSLSQVAGTACKTPLESGKPGHGCGHHLLGSASALTAVGVKKFLEETGSEGTVIYFGCPGEEGGSGKAFMAKGGVFDDLDIAFTWHPGDVNGISTGSSLANVQVLYKFKGVAAHAAGCPHLGRSALDAVELMNVGSNFLREHLIQEARLHYAITNAGGYSPNVVQPTADVLYLIRSPKNAQVQDMYARVNKIAHGAAMMTETEVEIDFVKACSNTIPNEVLEKVLYKNLHVVGAPKISDDAKKLAVDIQGSIENLSLKMEKLANDFTDKDDKKFLLSHKDDTVLDFILPFRHSDTPSAGSTDVGDVSWVCPVAQINTACYAANTPGHSWQLVAQGKQEIAYKGMMYAAKVMALSCIDAIMDPTIIKEAKAEHAEKVGDGYVCPIPDGVKPRAISNNM